MELFKLKEWVYMPLAELDKFREEIAKLPELCEYDMVYSEDEVKIRRR